MSRIDPRVLRTLRLVREAAVVELAAAGWGGFTIEAVAARAGVARSTVYRHWPDRRSLLVDALEHHSTQPPAPPAGTARQRVEQLVTHLAEAMADPAASAMAIALVDAAERDDHVRVAQRDFATRRRQALVDALGDAGAPEPELAAVALAGAVLYRRALTDEPLTPAEVPRLVATVLQPTSP